jgi:glycosyltransferase involved in cell wall biosynthesis
MAARQRALVVVVNWRDLDHPEAGGAEVVCDEMAAALVDTEHDVVLLCAKVKGSPRDQLRRGYTIHRAGGRFTVYPRALAWLMTHRSRITLVVDSQNGIPFFAPLAIRRKTPLLLLIHHVHQEQFSAYFPRPIAALGRWLETSGSRLVYGRRMIVAVSPSTRRGVRQDLKLMGEIRVIPPGWRISTQADIWARCPQPKIAAVGRLVPHKRTRLVVEAMVEVRRAIPTASLDIIGSGPELAALQRLVADLDLEDVVQFHPSCSNERRDELVSSAWLSINASAGEGWGISVIESNALGIPVLAFDRPGLRDSIRDGETGWLIEEGSQLSIAISKALRELSDPDAAAGYAQRARHWAAGFTWEEMGDKLRVAALMERRRMALLHPDRRTLTDVGTVIHIVGQTLDPSWSPQLRVGDTIRRDADGLQIFLASADTASGLAVLARCGLPDGARDDDVSIRVARGSDYLMPQSGRFRSVTGQHPQPGETG